ACVIGSDRDAHEEDDIGWRWPRQPTSITMDSTITVSPRGEERLQNGHFWIYRSDVMAGSACPGEVVRVAGPRGRFLGRAFFSDRSQITLRMLTQRDVQIDRPFWRRRIEEAIRF